MVERTGFKEGDVETGCEAPVHVLVDDVICFAADET